ncbi:MAG: alpha-mannosidase [Roseburia sp.]|nr:alpha-mannosidase [Roseburia sp.]
MSLGRQWDSRLRIWDNAFLNQFYQPVGKIDIQGFTTMEQLSFAQAVNETYRDFPVGEKWGRKWEYGWFRGTVTLPEEAIGKRVVMTLGVAPEMLVFVNGKEAGSIDKQHFYINLTDCAQAGAVYEIYAEGYAGHGPREEGAGIWSRDSVPVPEPPAFQCTIKESTFGVWNQQMFLAYADYHTLYELWKKLPESSLRGMQIGEALKEFTYKADFELPEPERTESIVAAREILKPLLEKRNGDTAVNYTVFGQSHLDLAWLWTAEETKRKSARTYSNQLALMERYPEYRFLLCSPTVLENLKEYYPDLYKRVKEKVENGQFIPEGAVYIESDTNLPNGESLIQQFVRGKRWFKNELDVDSKMAWLPDTFGFSGALPQIMKGCDVPYFATQKLLRCDPECEQFPYNIFWWEGIDGSKVLSHIFKKNNAVFTPDALISRWEDDRNQKENIDGMFFPFGYGDGGGGPTEMMVETYLRCKDLEGLPRCQMESPIDYFERIDAENVENTYYGELYFAWHRGTYTSQAGIKKGTRKAEFALREAQYLTGLLRLKQNTLSEEQKNALEKAIDQIEEYWNVLLFQEFHDILPGSSIERVNEEARDVLEKIEKECKQLAKELLVILAGEGVIFNSLSWERKLPDGTRLPACGYARKNGITTGQSLQCITEENAGMLSSVTVKHPKYEAEVDTEGRIVRLLNVESGYSYVAQPLNELKLYQDINVEYDAWELGRMYEQIPVELEGDVKVTVQESDNRVVVTVNREEKYFTWSQDIIFDTTVDWITFKTKVDWHERHRILKVDFPTTVYTKEAIEEIQFGYLKRPTHKSRQFEKDMYETCQHKYSALTDGENGLAILNDCKYGISAQDSKLSLTLLKAPVMPDMNADQGEHEFSYALYPFGGPFNHSKVPEAGYEFNLEPTCSTRENAGNDVANATDSVQSVSFFRIEGAHAMIDTCKPAMDEKNAVVLRLYEYMGSAGTGKLYLPQEVKKCFACNMLEDRQGELVIKKSEDEQYVELNFHAFEIKTLMLEI